MTLERGQGGHGSEKRECRNDGHSWPGLPRPGRPPAPSAAPACSRPATGGALFPRRNAGTPMAVGARAEKGIDGLLTFYPAILCAFTGIWRGNAGKKKGLAANRKPLIFLQIRTIGLEPTRCYSLEPETSGLPITAAFVIFLDVFLTFCLPRAFGVL